MISLDTPRSWRKPRIVPRGWKLAKNGWLWRRLRKGDDLSYLENRTDIHAMDHAVYSMFAYRAEGFDNVSLTPPERRMLRYARKANPAPTIRDSARR